MINREATIRWKGYDPDDLSFKSNKKICCICDGCGKVRWIPKYAYHDLCLQCACKTEEFRSKRRNAAKRENLSQETLKKMSESSKRENLSDETIKKLSDASRRENLSPENLNKKSYASRRENLSQETLKKMSESSKCENMSVEERELRSRSASGKNNGNWQGGISGGRYCYRFNAIFKEKIRDLFGRMCFLCGITEEEIGKKLDVHHVNYDKDCLCNSSCEFVPLCRSCHSKTNGRRQYWEDLIVCYLYPDRITMIDQ